MEILIVPDYRYSYGSEVVSIDMSTFYIITSCPPFIYNTSLSDDKIVANISPSFRLRMVEVDSANQARVIHSLFESLCGMMDKNTIDLF